MHDDPLLPAKRSVSAPTLAKTLGCSSAAVELTHDAEVVDLHVDTYIPRRLWGYDPLRRHRRALLGRHFFGHLDVPRLAEGGLSGAMWSITTNPFRWANSRWRLFRENLEGLRGLVDASEGRLGWAPDARAFRAVRETGAHACIPSIQGGNALVAGIDEFETVSKDIARITLIHLTNSLYGASSSPFSAFAREKGLSSSGRDLVARCNAHRVFVDLAHIHPTGFWDAVEVHDSTQPLLSTHTGVTGVCPSWRNLDDEQIRAIADTGGVIGIIFSTFFLSRPGGPSDGAMVVEHMEHVIDVGGEGVVAIGSDYDGAISPPTDLFGARTYPRLVQHMLDRGWPEARIRRVLGENFLRAFESLRPGPEETNAL